MTGRAKATILLFWKRKFIAFMLAESRKSMKENPKGLSNRTDRKRFKRAKQ